LNLEYSGSDGTIIAKICIYTKTITIQDRKVIGMGNKDSNLLVQTLVKGLDVLECFESDIDEKGIKEISQTIDMPESSIYRILQTLEYKGLIIQNAENKKYRLGLKLLRYRDKTSNMYRWKQKARVWMEQLSNQCGETVNLAIRDEEYIMYIDKVECKHLLRPNFVIGEHYPSYCTSLGKVLLSDVSEQTLDVLFDKFPKDINQDFEVLKMRLNEVKDQGYAIDDEEFQIGLKCVAAPIKAFGGRIMAAISVTIPTVRLDEETFLRIKELVIEAAEKISEEVYKVLK